MAVRVLRIFPYIDKGNQIDALEKILGDDLEIINLYESYEVYLLLIGEGFVRVVSEIIGRLRPDAVEICDHVLCYQLVSVILEQHNDQRWSGYLPAILRVNATVDATRVNKYFDETDPMPCLKFRRYDLFTGLNIIQIMRDK